MQAPINPSSPIIRTNCGGFICLFFVEFEHEAFTCFQKRGTMTGLHQDGVAIGTHEQGFVGFLGTF
jgi:hypothetical protein